MAFVGTATQSQVPLFSFLDNESNGALITCFRRGDELKDLTEKGSVTVTCPRNCNTYGGSADGSDPFTIQSKVCSAAITAGKITDAGGEVTAYLSDPIMYPQELPGKWTSWVSEGGKKKSMLSWDFKAPYCSSRRRKQTPKDCTSVNTFTFNGPAVAIKSIKCKDGKNGQECSGATNGSCELDEATAAAKCTCVFPWTGETCDELNCPTYASNAQQCGGSARGTCDRAAGKCTCKTGFNGDACEWNDCKKGLGGKECSGATSGTCDKTSGKCNCQPNWTGDACEHMVCPKSVNGTECSGNGACDTATGVCKCKATHGES